MLFKNLADGGAAEDKCTPHFSDIFTILFVKSDGTMNIFPSSSQIIHSEP